MKLSAAGKMFIFGVLFYIIGTVMEIVFKYPRKAK